MSIAVTGSAHANMSLPEVGNMQDNFPYSYLIIYGPKAKTSLQEFSELESHRVNMDTNTFIRELRTLKGL